MNGIIATPQRPAADTDVTLDCERAIEGTVLELVDQAIAAGWSAQGSI